MISAVSSLAVESKPALVRSLGRWSLAAIVVNGIIGSAIFILPGQIAWTLGWWSLAAWLIAGAFAAAIIFCFAEVSSRFAGSGGAYLFAEAAFGPFIALQIGWLSYFVRAITAATVANAFSTYLALFLPWSGTRTGGAVSAAMFIGLLAAVNIRSTLSGARVSNTFAWLKVTPLVVLGGLGLMWVASGRSVSPVVIADAQVGDWLQSLLLLMFAFGGFETAVIPLAEAKTPGKDAPFALLTGLAVCTVLYLLAQLTVLGTLANPDPTVEPRPLAAAAGVMIGNAAATVTGVAALVSVYGWLSGNMLTVPRLSMAMAERGDFPAVLARVHVRYRTPWVSVIVFATLSWALAAQAGFLQNLSLSAISRLLVYGVVCASLPVFRWRDRLHTINEARFRAPGGMILAGIGLLACVLLATRMNMREGITLAIVVGLATLQWFVRPRRTMKDLFQ